jgi:hypothetical protein
MSTQEFESTPDAITPPQRYFSDVIYKSNSYVDMLISLEKYMELSGVGMSQAEIAELVGDGLHALDYQSELSKKELRDIFTILPFLVIGPVVDEKKGIADVRKWYDDALAYLRVGMRKAHGDECLDSPHFAFSNQCEHGQHCPLISVAKYLEADLFDTDFSTPKYDHDTLTRYAIAVEKERAAMKHKLRGREQGEGMIAYFQKNYTTHLYGPQ